VNRRILVVKSGTMFRGAFKPIARQIIDVDTPGITSPNLASFRYQKLRRPMFPLDDIKDMTDG
jgi:microcystin degradation protein MlrC